MFTSSAFDRRFAALERAEAGRNGRPLADLTLARVALSRRLSSKLATVPDETIRRCQGRGLLIQG